MDPSFIGYIEFQPAYDVGVIFEALASACARLQQKGQRAQTIGWFTMLAETWSVPSARGRCGAPASVYSWRRCKRHRTNVALATARMPMKMVADMCSWRAANLRKWTPSCWTRWKFLWGHEMQRDFAKSSILLVNLYHQIHPEMLENHEWLFVALGQGN